MRQTLDVERSIRQHERKLYWQGLWAVIKGDPDQTSCEFGWGYRWLRVKTVMVMLINRRTRYYKADELPRGDKRAWRHCITVAGFNGTSDGYGWHCNMIEFHPHQFSFSIGSDGESTW